MTVRSGEVVRIAVLSLLAIDGVISAILGIALLNLRVGATPAPLGLLVSAVFNVVLVWCALEWAPSRRWAGVPIWAFLAIVTILTFGGPGGDVVFTGLGPVWLLGAGVLPAEWLRRRGVS